MRRAWLAILLAGAALATACRTASPEGNFVPSRARFFLEAGSDTPGIELVLPQSETRLVANAKPVITEGDVMNVELVQVDLGKCLLFQLTPSAARDFYRLSGSYQGRRLVLIVNDSVLGARRIDGAISDGNLLIFVEVPDDQLRELVDRLKQSAGFIQREIARRG